LRSGNRSGFTHFLAIVAAAFVVVLSSSQVRADSTLPVITVTSPTLQAGQPIPRDHTPDGRNESPALNWSHLPAGTKELAVLCEDYAVGNPPPFVHWIVYSIPGTATGLPAALPIDDSPMPPQIAGAVQGLSGFRRAIYRGPAPPRGSLHEYHFVVYALDTKVSPPPDQPPLTRAQLLDAIDGHVIGKGELVATYRRE
jgi:Raf kinase inhibitor-like YbhB/YbcL family protein